MLPTVPDSVYELSGAFGPKSIVFRGVPAYNSGLILSTLRTHTEFAMTFKVFIDGRHGTTGLKIDERLQVRSEIEILTIPEAQRKDAAVKAEQVKDAKTVESLGKELKASAPEYEGCVAENAQGLDAATVKLNEQADWYETHEKSLSKAVRAVVESKAAKRLDDAKTNLTAKLDEASKLLADSDGKVADNATRDALSNAIDAANGLKDGNDPAKIDGARKTLEDAINGVNASVQAKTDADAQAAAAAAAAAQAQAQAQSTYSGVSSYSGGAYRRTEGSTSGSNTYRGTTSGGTGSGSTSGSGPAGGSAPKPNLNGSYGCGNSCTGKYDGYYHH